MIKDKGRHYVICQGYKRIYKDYERISNSYRNKGFEFEANIYKEIADEFKNVHEKYLDIIK